MRDPLGGEQFRQGMRYVKQVTAAQFPPERRLAQRTDGEVGRCLLLIDNAGAAQDNTQLVGNIGR